ncbi:aromatic acid exporter family protein [Cyanobium sp. WAJ14-Wanaka]|uniref:FUSC family protein n=1 Tax=Cyanobium sp. WAJ14-Wanaka TaxID=2823725 RepID=UPI0020CD4CD0|nr:aromatic acid exporter family protein [Cyanobium sp. WAJ14-Wanaka]MCP9774258.1 FUSC family protein [Cyanobium sp. WAJ14-Wanaka]
MLDFVLSARALKAAIKYGIAAMAAAAISVATNQVEFIWYPLLAVVMCMDETETRVLAASRARVCGTIAGGLVAFLVHLLMGGWIGITVTMLIVVPLLRLLGWGAGMATAIVVVSLLFLVADYNSLDWFYVLNRTVDTLLGVVVSILVSALIWPVNRLAEIRALDSQLRSEIGSRLEAIQQLLKGSGGGAIVKLVPVKSRRLILQLGKLVSDELSANPLGLGLKQRWRQRSILWERINHHSIQVQRLAELLPEGVMAHVSTPWIENLPSLLHPSAGSECSPLPQRQSLVRLADQLRISPLLLLSLDDELQRLVKSIHSLGLAGSTSLARP